MADEQADSTDVTDTETDTADIADTDSGEADASAAGSGGEADDGLDLQAERARLDEVESKIEEGRRALADADKTEPESDGPPVAAGEGAANAPPG